MLKGRFKSLSLRTTYTLIGTLVVLIFCQTIIFFGYYSARKNDLNFEIQRIKLFTANYVSLIRGGFVEPLVAGQATADAISHLAFDNKQKAPDYKEFEDLVSILVRDYDQIVSGSLVIEAPEFYLESGDSIDYMSNVFQDSVSLTADDSIVAEILETARREKIKTKTVEGFKLVEEDQFGERLINRHTVEFVHAEEHYQAAKRSKKMYVGPPLVKAHNGRQRVIFSVAVPLLHENYFFGALCLELDAEFVNNLIADHGLYDNAASISILSHDGLILAHSSDVDLVTENVNQTVNPKARALEKYLNVGDYSHYSRNGLEVSYPAEIYSVFPPWQITVTVPYRFTLSTLETTLLRSRLASLAIFFIAFVIFFLLTRTTFAPLKKVSATIQSISRGNLNPEYRFETRFSDYQRIIKDVEVLLSNYKTLASIAEQIGKGNLNVEFQPLSAQDSIGNALIEMRLSLIEAKANEEVQRLENEKRNWITHGIALFGDVLRKNNSNINDYAFEIVRFIIEYTGATQGGLFILNIEDEQNIFLELAASYAYNQRKYLRKQILPGEGLVGACLLEKATIHMTEVPQGYVEVTSGLGHATPDSLLIVPLKTDDRVYGVIEVASVEAFEPQHIQFIEEIAEDIASSIATVKTAAKNARLLEESKLAAEELASQEEEMRQNLEELRATQEESARRESELMSIMHGLQEVFIVVELDKKGAITSVNQRYAELFGRHIHDFAGKNIFDNLTYAEQYRAIWRQVMEHQIADHEIHYMDRDIWLKEIYTPVVNNDDEVYKVVMLAFDVTKNKMLDMELREKEEELRAQEELMQENFQEFEESQQELNYQRAEVNALFDAIDQALITAEIDLNGKFMRVNRFFCQYFDIENEDQILGLDINTGIPSDELTAFREIFSYVKSGSTQKVTEHRIINEVHRKVYAVYMPVVDSEGVIVKYLYVANDAGAF